MWPDVGQSYFRQAPGLIDLIEDGLAYQLTLTRFERRRAVLTRVDYFPVRMTRSALS